MVENNGLKVLLFEKGKLSTNFRFDYSNEIPFLSTSTWELTNRARIINTWESLGLTTPLPVNTTRWEDEL